MELSLVFHMTTPIGHMEVTDHMTPDFFNLHDLGSSLDLHLLVIPHVSFNLCQ